MSISLMLSITAAAVAAVLFADKATQWTLRTLLSDFSNRQQTRTEEEQVMVQPKDDDAQAVAQAA